MRDPFTPAAKPGALSCARAEAVTSEFCCLESLMTLQDSELTMPILQKSLVGGKRGTVSCPKFNSREVTRVGTGIPS